MHLDEKKKCSVQTRIFWKQACHIKFYFRKLGLLTSFKGPYHLRKKLRDVQQERKGKTISKYFLTISNNFVGVSRSILLYLSLSQSISVYLGPSWFILDYLGLSWTISDYLGLVWTILDNIGLSRTISDNLSRFILVFFWLSWSISVYLGSSRCISLHLGLSQSISVFLGLSQSISVYLGLSVSISVYLSLFCTLSRTISDQSIVNISILTEYKYKYIRNVLFNTNANRNIFGINLWTKYKYKYIRKHQVDRIRIFEYFWLEYSNIICEYSNIPWNAAIGIKFCIPKIPRSQFKFA